MAKSKKVIPPICLSCGKIPKINIGKIQITPKKTEDSFQIACENPDCEIQPCTDFHPTLEEALKVWSKRFYNGKW